MGLAVTADPGQLHPGDLLLWLEVRAVQELVRNLCVIPFWVVVKDLHSVGVDRDNISENYVVRSAWCSFFNYVV